MSEGGQLCAWLDKKKSGASTIRVRQYNRRFFTLDFDTHTFFYTHAEGSKKVSAVTSFADIIDIRLPEAPSDNASVSSKSSKFSMFSHRPSFMKAPKDAEDLTLTVYSRPAREMELLCSSAEERTIWYEALHAARAMDNSQTTVGTEDGVSAPAPFDDDEDEQDHRDAAPAAAAGGYPPAAAPAAGGYPARGDVPRAPLPRAPVAAAAVATAVGGATDDAEDEDEGDPIAPPPAAGTFLDLNIEDKPDERPSPSAAVSSVPDADATMVMEGSVALQASDLGFEEAEDSDADSSDDDAPELGAIAEAPEPADTSTAGVVRIGSGGSYGDKHSGLTMQERLANLEFSDDEDDDDDPLGLKKPEDKSS